MDYCQSLITKGRHFETPQGHLSWEITTKSPIIQLYIVMGEGGGGGVRYRMCLLSLD